MRTERRPVGLNSEVGDKSHGHRVKENGTFENSRALESKRDAKDHDDCRTAARDGRHSGCRLTSERGWWKDFKGEERAPHKVAATSDAKEREGKSRVRGGVDHEWRHDRYSETKTDARPPTKKRRPFREEKLPSELQNLKNAIPEPNSNRVSQLGSSALRSGRWEEGARDRRPLERNEQNQPYARERSFSNRGRIESTSFPARDGFNSVDNGGKFEGRDKYVRTQGYWSKGSQVEKWKHDLFDEANRSPTPKKEEDPVAKVEALLSM